MAAAPDAIVVASVVQIPPRSLARNTAAGAPAALEQRRAAALPLRPGTAAAVLAPRTEREDRQREMNTDVWIQSIVADGVRGRTGNSST